MTDKKKATGVGVPQAASKSFHESHSNQKRLAPYGKLSVDRQCFNNPAWLTVVCVGGDAWNSAKARNSRGDSVGLVLPPGEHPAGFTWPVNHCLVVVEWTQPAPEQLIVELAKALLIAGAESVTVWPRWEDYSNPHLEWPEDKQLIETYQIRREVANAA